MMIPATLSSADKRGRALAAAHAATEAATELLRAVREDDFADALTLDLNEVEIVEKLCDAAKMVIEIDDARQGCVRAPVYAALCRFLEGWA